MLMQGHRAALHTGRKTLSDLFVHGLPSCQGSEYAILLGKFCFFGSRPQTSVVSLKIKPLCSCPSVEFCIFSFHYYELNLKKKNKSKCKNCLFIYTYKYNRFFKCKSLSVWILYFLSTLFLSPPKNTLMLMSVH